MELLLLGCRTTENLKVRSDRMNNKHFLAAMYLRLSRDDESTRGLDAGNATDGEDKTGKAGFLKAESNSIGNQRELIRAFIHEQQDIELFDSYVDDGFSGSNFDRPEFKRMIKDIEAGKVNCVIVKDLSRFGRDYIESGRYIQKIFPALSVRFIALTDHYDSFRADTGESGIILPVKNFINDSYCRDISIKVKSQFEVKRKNGQCIAPFAPYGYRKAKGDKHQLVIDEYAAEIIRKVFAWKIEGLALSAIAEKLNGMGILSPKEYKKFIGTNYKGGFSGTATAHWSVPTIKRILTNEVYLGHMVQGKSEKINYKLKKSIKKPETEWIRVKNTHEAIVSEDSFQVVQHLLKADGRVSPTSEKTSFFMGILFCGDCGEQMIRRTNRYKDRQKVYYICSTKNRGEGCSRHSIEEEKLKVLVLEMVRKYANCFLEEKRIFEQALRMETNFESIVHYDSEIARLKAQRDKYYVLCSNLYEDLRHGIITKEEFERLHCEFNRKAAELEAAQKKQENMIKELFKNGVISTARLKTMQECSELKEIDRHTLCSMVRKISVLEGRRIEIEFRYADQYRLMLEMNKREKEFEGQRQIADETSEGRSA